MQATTVQCDILLMGNSTLTTPGGFTNDRSSRNVKAFSCWWFLHHVAVPQRDKLTLPNYLNTKSHLNSTYYANVNTDLKQNLLLVLPSSLRITGAGEIYSVT